MLNVGKNIITDSLIFHYDMKDQNSYKGEPTYNIFKDASIKFRHWGTKQVQPYAGYNYKDTSVYRTNVGTINFIEPLDSSLYGDITNLI